MKMSDILGMSLSNLWRRKTRAVLTILGVIIGTASIVVMLSLGIGLKYSMTEQVDSAGGLTQVSVYMDYDGDMSSSQPMLDDNAIETFLALDNVKSVDPVLEYDMPIKVGIYEGYASIYGVSEDYLKKIPLGGGELPKENASKLQLVAGNRVPEDFMIASTGDYPYWDTDEMPDVDMLSTSAMGGITIESETEDSEDTNDTASDSQSIFPSDDDKDSDDEDEKEVIASDTLLDEDEVWEEDDNFSYSYFGNDTKRVPVEIVGIAGENAESINAYSYNYYTNVESLKKFLAVNYPKNAVIPGQPSDREGKPFPDIKYSTMLVNVNKADNVETVLQEIQDLGYRAESEKEWLEETKKQFVIIEAVLGGIGGVAMLVAAISIANTMTMSTYERTKEIGVMKVLGCKLGNIRAMFLSEAAFIGFFGGLVGIGLSFLLSLAVNRFAPGLVGGEIGLEDGMKISVIPFWLIITAIVFSTVIGMLAGFFPAQRATQLSPLAAIRNE